MVHKQRGVIEIVLVLLLVAALGAAGYFYLQGKQTPGNPIAKWFVDDEETLKDRYVLIPTSDPTAGWKVFEDRIVGFSFRYPGDWEDITNQQAPNYSKKSLALLRSPVVIQSATEPLQYVFSLDLEGVNQSTVAEIVDKRTKEVQQQDPKFSLENRKRIVLDGKTAERIVGLPSAHGSIQVLAIRDSILYTFMLNPYDPTNVTWKSDKYARIFDQILSTFKFLD